MTVYNRGDVVLVGFLFSDESTKKLRPAVVISSARLQPFATRDHRRRDHEDQTPPLRRLSARGLEGGWAPLPVPGDRSLSHD